MNKTNLVLVLLFLNLLAPIISFFGYHIVYLTLIAGTGIAILVFFFTQKPNKTAFIFEVLVFIMFLLSFLNLHYGQRYFTNMANDLATLGLFATPFLLKTIINDQLRRSLILVFLVSIIMFFYVTLSFYDFVAFFGIADRDIIYKQLLSQSQDLGFSSAFDLNTITPTCVAYSTVFLLFFPLISNDLPKKSFYFIIVLLVIQILFYIVYSQKRQTLLDLFVILALAATVNRKLYSSLFSRNVIINIIAFTAISYLVLKLPIFDNVLQRFTDVSENIQEFDRLEESRTVLSEFTIVNYFIGNGLAWASTKAVSSGETIHIGYINLLMKGGLLFLLFYFVQCAINIIYCYRASKFYPKYSVGISITVFSMIQLAVAPGYGWWFQSIVTGMAMFSRFFLDALVIGKYKNQIGLKQTFYTVCYTEAK